MTDTLTPDDDWDWNPDIVTTDGEPIEIAETNTPAHQSKSALLEKIRAGKTISEMADEFGISKTRVRHHINRHDIDVEVTRKPVSFGMVNELHERGGIGWRVNQGYDGPVTDGGPLLCPECDAEYTTESEQQSCIRRHARDRADQLQRWADAGGDVFDR